MADTCALTNLILISNFLFLCLFLLQKQESEIPESPVTLTATHKMNGYVTQLSHEMQMEVLGTPYLPKLKGKASKECLFISYPFPLSSCLENRHIYLQIYQQSGKPKNKTTLGMLSQKTETSCLYPDFLLQKKNKFLTCLRNCL